MAKKQKKLTKKAEKKLLPQSNPVLMTDKKAVKPSTKKKKAKKKVVKAAAWSKDIARIQESQVELFAGLRSANAITMKMAQDALDRNEGAVAKAMEASERVAHLDNTLQLLYSRIGALAERMALLEQQPIDVVKQALSQMLGVQQ